MHKDYIMRMIEQFMKALAAIVRSRKSGDYEEAFSQIQTAGQRYLQTDLLSLLSRAPEQVADSFRDGAGRLDAEKCVVGADLLYELALIFEAKRQIKEARRLKVLCLQLYEKAIPMDERFQDASYFEKLKVLTEELER